MSFGKMPIANGFLSPQEFEGEYFFELAAGICRNCGMFQLIEQPDPKKMFHKNYAFFSSTSTRMAIHFREFASRVAKDYLSAKDPFVVEIGSNDGILLRNFAEKGVRHLGIEPSANVAEEAIKNGIKTISSFFDENLAKSIVKEQGRADAFLGANVMCHIGNLNSVISGIKTLLKPDGIVMFEDPYLGDVIEKTSYDQIYDEHVFLFSATSIKYAFSQFDMELVDVEPQETHGGSMRYIIAAEGARKVSDRVHFYLEKEKKSGLAKKEIFDVFRDNCEKSKNKLVSLLKKLKTENKRVVGYAATSKSTTVLNYCGIGPDLVEFICDTTPIKQGKFSPGAHIPVHSPEEFKRNYPDYALLFAWNHEKEIIAKESEFKKKGGKFIIHVPEVHAR